MILDLKTQKKAIYEWAKKELEIEFIWEDQNGHRPVKPYGTLKIIPGFSKVGSTDNMTFKAGSIFNLAGLREFTLSLNCYGENAIGRANFVASSIDKPSVTEKFSIAELVAVRCEQVQDLSRVKDNEFETRAQVDIKFRTTVIVEDDIGIIETVEIKNEVNNKTIIIDT